MFGIGGSTNANVGANDVIGWGDPMVCAGRLGTGMGPGDPVISGATIAFGRSSAPSEERSTDLGGADGPHIKPDTTRPPH